MSHPRFRVNVHLLETLTWRSLLETGAILKVQVTAAGINSTTTYFIKERSTIQSRWKHKINLPFSCKDYQIRVIGKTLTLLRQEDIMLNSMTQTGEKCDF